MNIINLTPHVVNVRVDSDKFSSFPPEPVPARCREIKGAWSRVWDQYGNTLWVEGMNYSTVVDIPEPTPDTIYIVSQMVAAALPHRIDLVYPSEVVRNSEGQIVGCFRLARITTEVVELTGVFEFDANKKWNDTEEVYFFGQTKTAENEITCYKFKRENWSERHAPKNGVCVEIPYLLPCSIEEYKDASDRADYHYTASGNTFFVGCLLIEKSDLPG